MASNPLLDVLPAKYRRLVYALAAAAAFLYALWLASNGDWRQFVAALLGSLVAGTAHANTAKTPKNQRGAADVGLGLLIVAVIGIVLLLFRVHFR